MTRIAVMSLLMLLIVATQTHAQNGAEKDTADVVGQSSAGPLVSADGATLIRTKKGITIKLSMPTPLPGSYEYPDGTLAGHPETFTGWAFVFNNPDLCTDPCNGDDIGAGTPAQGGAYNIAGHASGGGNLQMVGHVAVGETPFGGADHAALHNPAGAEVHVAVAPHGMLDPSIMPDQIKTPIGNPSLWWLAFFIP